MASGLVSAATFSDRAKSLLDVAKDGFTILRDFCTRLRPAAGASE